MRAITDAWTNGKTVGQTDGRYQTCSLPCFAVDNNKIEQVEFVQLIFSQVIIIILLRHVLPFYLSAQICIQNEFRQHSLYSLVHETQQRFSSHVRQKKNTTDLVKKKFYPFWHVGGKNKKKTLECQFFLIGHILACRRNQASENIASVALWQPEITCLSLVCHYI